MNNLAIKSTSNFIACVGHQTYMFCLYLFHPFLPCHPFPSFTPVFHQKAQNLAQTWQRFTPNKKGLRF
jgi:hypothetical protein